MRDIKFRAKRSDDGAWVYGDLTHVQKICSVEEKNKTGKSTIPVVRVAGYDVDEESIGQFTGLLDKNGKEIYEGDIVRFDDTPYIAHGNKYEGNVMMYRGAYCVRYNENWCDEYFFAPLFADYFADRKTVILGNVYDNKDLLKRNRL